MSEDTSGLIEKFNAWDKAIDGSSQGDWREEARDCFGMVAGDQVPQDDLDKAKDANILYAILNKIDPTVSAICGSEITNRQEVRYYPREMSTKGPDGQAQDAKVNEILTAAAEYVRDECDAADEESETFRDTVICGMGWTETRMSYDQDQDGMALVERVDPLEMAWDASARRPNLADKRYLRRKKRFSKAEAAERFNIDPEAYGTNKDGATSPGSPHDADLETAYKKSGEPPLRKDEIEISEYQWYSLEPAFRVANPATNEVEDLTPEQYAKLKDLGLQAVEVKARRYYRAWRIADEVLKSERLPEDEFTLKCVTGKLDRNKGIWYGVVRAMRDPQRLLNKQASQLQRIVDVTAKGGLLAEAGAFEDPEQAKQDWAASDTIVYTKEGAVKDGRVIPKPVGQYPAAIDKLFAAMNEMVPGVSGVNNEMLGLIDREQAGVVDFQRKQAAYGVLASFFNSLRRYRRNQGKLLLKLITKYMSDGRLIRIVGRQGNVQYLPLIRQPDTIKYDVVVDEAPAGPNQKERTFMFLTQFAPVLAKLGLPPQIWMKLMEYSPLPMSLVGEMQQMMQQMPPPSDPAMEKVKGELQLKQQTAAADQQASQAQMIADWQRTAQESAANAEIKRQEAYAKMVASIEESNRKAQEGFRQMMLDAQISMKQMQMDFVLGRMKIEADKEVGREKAKSNGVDTTVNGQ